MGTKDNCITGVVNTGMYVRKGMWNYRNELLAQTES